MTDRTFAACELEAAGLCDPEPCPDGVPVERQLTPENILRLFGWIDAGKFHYGADTWPNVGGLTLFTDTGRQVARFGDTIVRDATGRFSVRHAVTETSA